MPRFLKLCLTLLALLTFSLSIGRAADLKIGYYNKTATITMVGPIVRGDYDRFRQTVGKIADEGGIVTHLYIFSPGGLVNEALNIGRLAGKLALTTVAPTYDPAVPEKRQCSFREHTSPTKFVDHKWRYDAFKRSGNPACNCASACFLIWAAGAERQGNYLGIHRTFFRPQSFKEDSFAVARERYVKLRKSVTSYLTEMNIPNLVINTMFSVASNEIEPLAPQFVRILQGGVELEEYLRAHCTAESVLYDFHTSALELLNSLSTDKASGKYKDALGKRNAAYEKKFSCEVKVRKKIFTNAWAKVSAN